MTRNGILIELIEIKGHGRTHVIDLICALISTKSKKILYLDGSGNFRPEVIYEFLQKITNVSDKELRIFLKNITYQRIYEMDKLMSLLKKIKVLDIDCVIVDDVIPLFLYNQNKNIRHEVRRFIREISMIAITKKISMVFTSNLVEKFEGNSLEGINYELFYHDIIRYVHIKASIKRKTQDMIEFTFVHPPSLVDSKLLINLNPAERQ